MNLSSRAGTVLFLGTALLVALSGYWVSQRIEESILASTARSSAIFIEGLVGPQAQSLAQGRELSPDEKAKIREILNLPQFKSSIVELRLWTKDGAPLFDSETEAVSEAPPVMDEIEQVFAGGVTVELNDAHHDQQRLEQKHQRLLFEINAPIRETGTNRVIAVAEYYQTADKLHGDLRRAKVQTWLVVGALSAAFLLPLYPILREGSRTIESQRKALAEEQQTQHKLAQQNTELRGVIEQAHRRGVEINERSMRRIGADLHDGPAQLIGLALLKLDELVPLVKTAPEGAERGLETLNLVRQAMTDSLKEIRSVAAGLALPELERVSLKAALELASRTHEQRTRTRVNLTFGEMPQHLPLPVTICLFRFAQECLNNAFKHAGGRGQGLTAALESGEIVVTVTDAGPGIPPQDQVDRTDKLGLTGLKDRVESLGGAFELRMLPAVGTTVTARFAVNQLGKPAPHAS